ncbi:hypothetical protein F0L68_22230 [Solihabitans fulvus]|uniref:Peptidase A4 family protein n=1 Tax=Solihabitans fulvus TaxID=1892852 RepID=A0A5B2X5U8_9PSEU|nr:G1 family glutamic endopeptidase [Solihabitans fulvus]KAA2258576.1 hypothetical protein F0L68_22230 [Solihabitans fulvus]
MQAGVSEAPMISRRLTLFAFALVLCLAGSVQVPAHSSVSGAPPAGGAPETHLLGGAHRAQAELTWSGYVSRKQPAGTYTVVSAKWTQPSVTCKPGENSQSSFWVGLAGDNLVQTGIDANCENGVPRYSAWWEINPQAGPDYYSSPVRAGDRFVASVTANTDGFYTMTIRNISRNWLAKKKLRSNSPSGTQAAVIVEQQGDNYGPLARFGAVTFTGASANQDKFSLTKPYAIDMTTENGEQLRARTSGLDKSNESFTVTWLRH